jgi:hypothetical protein
MCSFKVFVVLSCAAHVVAANQKDDAQRPVDDLVVKLASSGELNVTTLANILVDKFFDRAFQASRLQYTNLDSATLGKPFGGHDNNQDQGDAEWKRTQPLARFSTAPQSVPWPVEEFGMEAANDDAEEAAMAASEAMDFQREASAAQAKAATATMAKAATAGANRPGTPSQTSPSVLSDEEEFPRIASEEFPPKGALPVPPLAKKLADKLVGRSTMVKASRLPHTDLDKATLGKPWSGGQDTAPSIVTVTTAEPANDEEAAMAASEAGDSEQEASVDHATSATADTDQAIHDAEEAARKIMAASQGRDFQQEASAPQDTSATAVTNGAMRPGPWAGGFVYHADQFPAADPA